MEAAQPEILRNTVIAAAEPHDRTSRPGRAGVGCLAFCLAGFGALCWLTRGFVTDDAWISARYAENIANGHGFVWNPTGPRAEGFSNPVLVAAEALAHLVGLSAVGTARTLGVASALALLLVLHRLGPAVVGRRATWVALVLTAFYPPIALWSVGGLETMSVALAITTGVLLLAMPGHDRRRALLAGGVLAFLPWLRPEGLVVALATVAAVAAPGVLRRGERRQALQLVVRAAGPALLAQVLLEAGRLAVYGHLLPNSVLYKTGSSEQFTVLGKFVAQSVPVLLAAAIGLAVGSSRQRVLAAPVAIYALGSIGTLDSVNAFSRFLLPVWPLLALLAGLGVAMLSRRLGRARGAVAIAATVLAGAVVYSPDADLHSVRAFSAQYASCKEVARSDAAAWLRDSTPESSSFALSDAGLVPARAGGRVAIDQLMLNEPEIQATGPVGDERRASFVYARRPGALMLVSRRADRFEAGYTMDAQLARDPRFHRYRLVHVARGRAPAPCAYNLFVFQRQPGRR